MTQEVYEAVNAANDALFHLTQADEMLRHAENWGVIDLIGGGLFSTMIKRSNMADAKLQIEQAKMAMDRLAGYLRQFRRMPYLNIEMDDFLGFADYFFDGIVTDWFAQSRINDAQIQVKNAIAEVQGILDGLEEIE